MLEAVAGTAVSERSVQVADGTKCALPVLTSNTNSLVASPFADDGGSGGGRQAAGGGNSGGEGRRVHRPGLIDQQTVCISIRAFRQPRVRIDLIGTSVFRVPCPLLDRPQHTTPIKCSVVNYGSSNLLVLDTMLRVRNTTDRPLLLTLLEPEHLSEGDSSSARANEEGSRVRGERGGVSDRDRTVHVLSDSKSEEGPRMQVAVGSTEVEVAPGATYSLPLKLAHLGCLAIRPSDLYSHSDPIRLDDASGHWQAVCRRLTNSEAKVYTGYGEGEAHSGAKLDGTHCKPSGARGLSRRHKIPQSSSHNSAALPPGCNRHLAANVGAPTAAGIGRSGKEASQVAGEVAAWHYIVTLESGYPSGRGGYGTLRRSVHGADDETQYTVVVAPPLVLCNRLLSPVRFNLIQRCLREDERRQGTMPPISVSSDTADPISLSPHGRVQVDRMRVHDEPLRSCRMGW